MSLRTRAKSLTVVTILAAGAVALIGSTQTWAVARLADAELAVSGATAVPVLQPLTLTVLALGLVLTLVGRALRYVLGALAVVVAAGLVVLSAPMLGAPPLSAVAPVVTEHTGLAGAEAIAGVVQDVTATAWPLVTLIAAILIGLAGLAALTTGHLWVRGGRRYDAAADGTARDDAAPLDAIDSWDELSRGDDPTR
ncbi:Trp biosynthesis-associated membrane protein [Microbacterium sp. JZ31]|uniref:Trp biosynthesis-associated membrane protein n=1 Tax=Microbacterium sp. JZ31 TaxID=1906274 RepID=UPI001933650E|nr:Trp biosynthesis-associated membrane protein [Microbacterium sp. JZ31]